MAIVPVTPTQVDVTCDWFDGRPRAVRVADSTLPVLDVERVREEAAAYRVEVGPRTTFQVRTPESRMVLAFQHRRRRWTVEGLEPLPAEYDAAA